MNENLKFTFANINEWLKFAEAKNAGLLALNAASIIGILQSQSIFEREFKLLSASMLAVFLLSTLFCIYSIVPDLRIKRFNRKMDNSHFQANKDTFNFLYFGTASKLSRDQYLELLKYKDPTFDISSLDKNLVDQIIANSEIANFKYAVFAKASWLTFAGFLIGVLTIVFKIFV